MQYYPSQPPTTYDPYWLALEFRRLAEVLEQGGDVLRITSTTVIPDKVAEGTIRRADGVNWDPGCGAGLYVYRGGAWQVIESGFTGNVPSMQFFLGE